MTFNKPMPNAQKWTEERVSEHLVAIYRDTFNEDTIYLGRALVNQGLYPDVWRYWKKIFARHDNIIETMKQIEAAFEAKLFEGALRKKLSPWISMFALRNNHGWKENQYEVEEEKQVPPMIIELSEDEIMIVGPGYDEMYKRIPKPNVNILKLDSSVESVIKNGTE